MAGRVPLTRTQAATWLHAAARALAAEYSSVYDDAWDALMDVTAHHATLQSLRTTAKTLLQKVRRARYIMREDDQRMAVFVALVLLSIQEEA